MLRRPVVACIIILFLGIIAPLRPAAADRARNAIISLQFQWIRQGQVGIVRVTGPDIAEVRAVFQERMHYFYPEDGGFTGLIAADMEWKVGTYTMQVWVKYADGTTETVDQDVEVNYGEFGTGEVTLSASLMPLLEPEVNRNEQDKLENILLRFTPERYWAGGFVVPSSQEIIGYFGAQRLYNGTYWYRHTGTDYRVGTGTPVTATANGRVVLSQLLPIRGNYILIDHGWGVYSGYAHLSERFVVPGQWVRQGETIGLSGNTGRSSGAHIHWEIAVGGTWVDPEAFQALGLELKEEE